MDNLENCKIELRVLLTPSREPGLWHAQVLDYDLAADGDSIDSVLYELSRIINVHIAASEQLGLHPFKCLDKAPQKCFDLWDKAKRLVATLPDLSPTILPKELANTELAVA